MPQMKKSRTKEKQKASALDISRCYIESIYDFKKISFNDGDDFENGYILGQRYIPTEILNQILSYLDPEELLRVSEVCKSWHMIARSHGVWMNKYARSHKRKPKRVPWFLYYALYTDNYFDVNLLENGDATKGLQHWDMNHSHPDYIVEKVLHAENLPEHLSNFFATYTHRNIPICCKSQKVNLSKSKFAAVILDYYKPHIYISEYASSCKDYNAAYVLRIFMLTSIWKKPEEHKLTHYFRMEDENACWVKKEIEISNYPELTRKLEYCHGSFDFEKEYMGHYGTIMTGGTVKILFDSIEIKENDKFITD